MKSFRGVLFDFDGTLVRTMEDHLSAWQTVAKEYGIEVDPSQYYLREGSPVHEIAGIFSGRELEKTSAEFKEIIRKKEDHFVRNHRFEVYPGVEKFLDELQMRGVPAGIVTAGLFDRITRSTPREFLSRFKTLVSGDKVARGKPFPDSYIMGASELGLAPESCIVVENAPLGITAAKQSGAYCVAICSTLERKHLCEADEIVDSFADLMSSSAIREVLK